jgi:hypothetical protein
MTEIIRCCPDCRQDRSFEQHHGQDGWCSDSPDQCCPEWHCVACGAGLLLGDIPVVSGVAFTGQHARVA